MLHDFEHEIIDVSVAIGHSFDNGDLGVDALRDGGRTTGLDDIEHEGDVSLDGGGKGNPAIKAGLEGVDDPVNKKRFGLLNGRVLSSTHPSPGSVPG